MALHQVLLLVLAVPLVDLRAGSWVDLLAVELALSVVTLLALLLLELAVLDLLALLLELL